jgi:hypothetical protein
MDEEFFNRIQDSKETPMKIIGALTLVTLCLAGCSGKEKEPVVEMSVDTYCEQVAAVACWNMWNCCTGQQIEDVLGITISVEPAECRRDVQLICEDNMATVLWAAYKGSVRLEEANADACFQSLLLAGDCFQHVSEIPWSRWCEDEHWFGTLQPGADCLYSFECVESSYCAADRKCKALPKENQECPSYECATGLFCNPSTGRCEGLKSSGQRCYSDGWCAAGLFCEFNEEGLGTCMGLKSLGVSCKGHYQCESTFCVPGLCQDGSECFENSECAGACSGGGDTCYSTDDCPGTCQTSHYACYSDWDCNTGESCLKETCQQRCSGESVCAAAWTVIDYCTDTLEGLLDN